MTRLSLTILVAAICLISQVGQAASIEGEQSPRKHWCPLCDRGYTRLHNLKTHFISRHPDQVSDYDQVFASRRSSKVNKKWLCPLEICPSGFLRKGDLKAHITRKHAMIAHHYPDIMATKSSKKGKRFECPKSTCPCGYNRWHDLQTHLREKHPEPMSLSETEDESRDDIHQEHPAKDTRPLDDTEWAAYLLLELSRVSADVTPADAGSN